MRTRYASFLVTCASLLACTERRVEHVKRDHSPVSAIQEADVRSIETRPEVSYPDFPKPRVLQLYPPKFVVIPSVLPPQDAPFVFGYDGTIGLFHTVYVYEVAAVPDFTKTRTMPDLRTEEKTTQFMNAWAAEFIQDPQNIAKLDSLAQTFRWQSDSNIVEQEAVNLPADLLASKPEYIKLTQRFLAQRFQFRKQGETIITGRHEDKLYQIPIVVEAFPPSARSTGEAVYKDPNTGCVGCHSVKSETEQAAYLKHSSDYLSSYTDEELLDIIQESRFPTGDDFMNGLHKFPLDTEARRTALLAYLRSLPTTYEKTLELRDTHKFKVNFPGWP
jgi:hypothetical protein